MKRTLVSALFLLLVSPSFASAQAAVSRYCPDQSQLFKGSIYHTDDGKPWIEVKVDPDFEQKELREKRHITGDIPLTPVYDLVVRIKPEFNYYCIKGWTADREVKAEQLPKSLPIKGFITIGTGGETVAGPGVFKPTEERDEQSRVIYEWKLKGWQKGIAAPQKLERLVQAIAQNQLVDATVEITAPRDKTPFYEKSSQTFDSCVPIGGGGPHRVVGMYTFNSLAVGERMPHFDSVRAKGFAVIEPLASYQSEFSYFVDLKSSETATKDPSNPGREMIRLRMPPSGEILKHTPELQNKALMSFIGRSTCQGKNILLLTSSKDFKNGVALQHASVQGAIVGVGHTPATYVHEFLHTFALLNDEYVYDPREDKYYPIPLTNCSLAPDSDYRFGSGLYGKTNDRGCSFAYQDTPDNMPKRYFYKPSATSLMASGAPVPSPNVPSCAFTILAIKNEEITKENAKKYFPECAKMDGVIKDGVDKSALSFTPVEKVFSWFTNAPAPTGNLFAAVGAMEIPSGAKVKVVVSQNEPPAEFVPLASGETPTTPLSCADPTAKRNPKDYTANLGKQAVCAQKLADATTLQQKIDDLNASITATDSLIASLNASKQEMSTITSLKGDTVYTIPAGEEQEKFYAQITKVAPQCVSGVALPLGTNTATKGSMFAPQDPKKVAQMLTDVRQKNKEANATYKSALAKGGKALTDDIRQIPTAQITQLQATLGATFMPVSKGILSKDYGNIESAKDFISVSMSLTFGASGAKKPCDTPYFLGGAVGAWFEGTITIDGVSYENACIPEANIIKKTKEGFDSNIAFFQKLKAKYQKSLESLQHEFDALKAKKYYCEDVVMPAVQTLATQVVRKSSLPSRSAPVQSNDGATLQSETSYLIVESFDPNNPWGEIVQVGEEDETVTTPVASPLVLSVGGATDAVGVKKGEEAKVEWTGGDGVVSCRSSWNPSEKLPPSGVANVLVETDGTFTVSCLDTEGKATSASVIVTAVNPPLFTRVADWVRGVASSGGSAARPTAIPVELSLPSETLSSVNALTGSVRMLLDERKQTTLSSTGESPLDPLLASLLARRKQELLLLARHNPDAFLLAILPNDVRKRIPQSLEKDVEADVTLTGTLEVWHADDFAHPENSETLYYLTDISSASARVALKSTLPQQTDKPRRVEVYLTKSIPAVSGTRVQIHGVMIDEVMVADTRTTRALQSLNAPATESIGLQRLAIILVTFADSPTPALTRDEIQKRVFDGSMAGFYKEQSYGKVSFTGETYGWFTIDKPGADFTKGMFLHEPAIQQLLKENNIPLSSYERVVVVLNTSTGFGGMGTVGKTQVSVNGSTYSLSQAWIGGFNKFGSPTSPVPPFIWDVFFDKELTHELGHNLGLPYHANGWYCGSEIFGINCGREEYGNYYDVMGHGDVALHFNAYFKEQLGWLDSSNIARISAPGSYTLDTFETLSDGFKAAKVFRLGVSGDAAPFYIEYRQPAGFDRVLGGDYGGTQKKGILINYIYDGRLYDKTSYLLDLNPQSGVFSYFDHLNASLPPDGVFLDRGRGISIGPFSNASASEVTFTVAYQQPECIRAAPRIQPRFPSQLVFPGGTSHIDVTISNFDNLACAPSEWTVELVQSDIPQSLWTLPDPVLAPGETATFSLTVNIPRGFLPGDYTTRLIFRDRSADRSQEVIVPIEVRPSAKILSVSPVPAVIGETLNISGRFFSEKGSNRVYLLNKNGGGFGLIADAPSKDGRSLQVTVPINLLGAKLSPGSYLLAVDPSDMGFSDTFPIEIIAGSDRAKNTTPATAVFDAANSFFVKPRTIAVNTPVTLGGISLSVSEPVILKEMTFRVYITGNPGRVWHLRSLQLRRGGTTIQGFVDDEDRVVFPGPIRLDNQDTFTIEGIADGSFSNGQTVTLSSVFWKDWSAITEREERPVQFSKKEIRLSTMTIQKEVSSPAQANLPADTLRAPARKGNSEGVNLSVAKPTLSGDVAGTERMYAGKMSLRASIITRGSGDGVTFKNVWQYRDVSNKGVWQDWATFTVHSLAVGSSTDAAYTWEGGAGEWEFRLVADRNNEIIESNEEDNISAPVHVVISARSGDATVPPPSSDIDLGTRSDALNLIPTRLTIRGTSLDDPAVFTEDAVELTGSVQREGQGFVADFKNVIQFAPQGGAFQDMATFEVPTLGVGEAAEVRYSFDGRRGRWRFRLCADNDSAIVEANETDNCSEELHVEIRGSNTQTAQNATGTPQLTLSIPLWTGTSAAGGKLRAGDMSLSVKIRNVGEGISKPVKGLWQYAVATGPFYDWVDVEFPPVEPDASVESSYSWQGGTGLWRARFCILESSAPEGRLCSGAVAVDIVQ